jgi:RNA polymerase sigma factor (sigma-70 family)
MELLRRFAQGDVEAFEALFRQFQCAVHGWILRIVREPSVAEELTVEAFWRAYKGRTRFNAEANFGAWMRRIATNLAIDYLRQRRTTVELPEDLASPDMHDPVVCREMRQKIRGAFCRLPPKLRAVATLALIEDTPYEEIASGLDISATAVRMRVFRAVRVLRKELDRMGLKP